MAVDVHEVVPGRGDLLTAITRVRATTDGELNPDDPAPPEAEVAGEIFPRSVGGYTRAWVASVDGDPAGELFLDFELEDNRHLIGIDWLATVPEHRGRGVAAALLRAGLDAASADDRTSVIAGVPQLPEPDPARAAGEAAGKVARAWAERLGLTARLDERCSRLRLADLDEGLVAQWLDEGRARSDGYEMVQFVGPAPDEHIDALSEALVAMTDAPIGELDYTFHDETPDYIRSVDKNRVERGLQTVRTLVRAADGRGVAISELHLNRHRPSLGFQGDTGVARDHRGHGLGRWVKAENLRLARELAPDLASVETYNAQSNPWMLDINVAMGFRPHIIWQMYQGEIATARDQLG